jgi:hypothetical protein
MDMLGFDGIVSVTQDALNFQLSTMYNLGVIPSSYTTSREKTSLNVTNMGAPTINLAPPGASHTQVLLTLPCIAGTFTYWDLSGNDPVLANATLNNNAMAFLVNMNIAEIDQAHIQALNATYNGKVNIAGPMADFTDDLFSINHLTSWGLLIGSWT